MNQEGISQGLAMIPSGVFVLATRDGAETNAILASFVQQSGFDPPSLVVAVGRDRAIRRQIESSGQFVLSVMGNESKASLRKFWNGVPAGTDPFEGLATHTGSLGIPIVDDAVGFLECSVLRIIDLGDHALCLAEVTDGGRIARDANPMVRIRKDGFGY